MASLPSLHAADVVRELVKDYDLPQHKVREGNVNRFMAFVGE